MSLRVLFLRRQKMGGLATLSRLAAEGLEEFGIEAVIDDAEDWIPDKTGWMVDRKVTPLVKRAAQGFDLVHAWGYRASWACSEALYVRSPWIYSAYDMPSTTQAQLIDRLNAARRGLCSSRSLYDVLHAADAMSLEIVSPACDVLDEPLEQEVERQRLELPEDDFLIVAAGRSVPNRGFEALAEAMSGVLATHPEARLTLIITGPVSESLRTAVRSAPDRIQILPPQPSLAPWLAAANLTVVPSRRQSFSMAGAEAMSLGKPTLLRRTPGLDEMAVDGHSAFYFDSDEELADRICQIIESPISREAMKHSARSRTIDRFSKQELARRLAQIYRDVLDR